LITEDLSLRGITASPIRGPAGNVEFLVWLGLVGHKPLPARDLIERALAEARSVDWEEASRA
jgi:23S rRNA (cytidine1920-2'-O)/16S rRNA (cytidine1409-2'-O)-methyltransferase